VSSHFKISVLAIGLLISSSSGVKFTEASSALGSCSDTPARSPYQRQDTWYEFILKQFNPENVDYGKWVEDERRNLIELRLKNPYFLYSLWTTTALILAAIICVKQRIDRRRAMSITAEMMADLYNQDAYSRQVAQEAIERYNKHIERCNRAIEGGEGNVAAGPNEIEQLRTELMRVAEERDTAIRDRDVAREELRRKSVILADMSVRLDAATSKAGAANMSKPTSDLRGADARLVTHINNLQEQLHAERGNNRRLKGG
jgi:hypothetical protein